MIAGHFIVSGDVDRSRRFYTEVVGGTPVPKQLDLDLLQRIRDAIDVNISLHGGSGTPGHYFTSAARIGVNKINLNSDMRYAYRTTLEAQLRDNPDEYAIVRLMPPIVRAVQDVVEAHIDLYGSVGHAEP
jgi:fructose-bisphosphate aldolase, class II